MSQKSVSTAISKEGPSALDPILSSELQHGEEITIKKKKSKKKGGKKKKSSKIDGYAKNTISILRTKLRNNIELTNLADSKANVLLSLNAIMLTFIVPFILPYIDLIKDFNLQIPLVVLVLTCLATIYLAVMVLRPGKLSGQKLQVDQNSQISPFFFGNFDRMEKGDYLEYAEAVLFDEEMVSKFLSHDFYHIGVRLAEKMRLVRKAFNIFMIGLITSILMTIILIFIQN
jgi:hypothetical protein